MGLMLYDPQSRKDDQRFLKGTLVFVWLSSCCGSSVGSDDGARDGMSDRGVGEKLGTNVGDTEEKRIVGLLLGDEVYPSTLLCIDIASLLLHELGGLLDISHICW